MGAIKLIAKKTSKKSRLQVNIIGRPEGTRSGGQIQRPWEQRPWHWSTVRLSIVSQVWINSSHMKRGVDAQLNEALRIITGVLKLTQTQWLSVLLNIIPIHIWRDESKNRIIKKCKKNKNSILYQILQEVPSSRLKSKELPCVTTENLISSNFCDGLLTWKNK